MTKREIKLARGGDFAYTGKKEGTPEGGLSPYRGHQTQIVATLQQKYTVAALRPQGESA